MNNKLKFLRGTADEYTAAEKDNDTIYFTTDNGKLYIGDKEVSGSDITIDSKLSNTSENPVQNKVINAALNEKASKDTMTGATSSTAGTSGLVPAPASGKQGAYLRGDGTWATLEFTGTLDDIPDGGGYYKSKYYIQVGTVTKASPMTVTFPVAYKTAPIVVCTPYLAEDSSTSTSGSNWHLKTRATKTGVTIYTGTITSIDGVKWVAFGEV